MAEDRENAGRGFSVRLEYESDAPVVTAAGELDLATESRMRESLRRAAEEAGSCVVADLTGLSFMDSSGLGLLIEQRSALREHGGDLWVVAGDVVQRLLEVAELEEAFRLHQARSTAVEEARRLKHRS